MRRGQNLGKRLGKYTKVDITELKDNTLEKEGNALLKKLKGTVFALSEEGKTTTSEEFAGSIKKLDGDVTFLIGGPFGLSKKIKEQCTLFSLSPMTFPHEMARMVLLEQLYRAHSILKGEPYHK